MSIFWKLRLSGIFFFEAGIFFSKLQFSVCLEVLIDNGSVVCCIGVFRWEELLSTLYMMVVTCLGDQIKRNSGMELNVAWEVVRMFVCIEL